MEVGIKKIINRILALALPMAGTQLITVVASFICMAMLAALGHEVLAASALIFTIRMTIYVVGASILFSVSVLVSHALGEKNYLLIGNLAQQGWTLAVLLAIPIIILFEHINFLLSHLGQSQNIIAYVQIFFHANVWNVFPFLLSVCNQQVCYGIRKQNIDLIANVIGLIVLLFVAYILIFGKLHFPKLGVAGLGYAMTAQGWFYFLITGAYLYFNKEFKRFALFRYRVHTNWRYLLKMLSVGWPICFQMGGELISLSLLSAMVGWLGVMELGAYQVILQYFFLVIIPLFAISQASSILVGQAYGSKQFNEINKLGYSSIALALFIALIVMFIFILFPHHLAALYINIHDPNNKGMLHLIISLFFISAFTQLFDGVRNVITGALRGLLDTKFPMFSSVFIIWVIELPLSYFLGIKMQWGVLGIALAMAMSMLTGMLIVAYRWHALSGQF